MCQLSPENSGKGEWAMCIAMYVMHLVAVRIVL